MTRTFAEISAGLDPVRPARPIAPGERVHVVGIAGSAAAGAAIVARAAGAVVSGCDTGGPSQYTEPASRCGIGIAWTHDPAHVVDPSGAPVVDRLSVTKALTSVHPDHPELAAARAAGIPTESVQQLIADAAATGDRRFVGVTGTHGKSTTTGWLVHLLAAAGRDPSAFVGALLPVGLAGDLPTTARIGSGPEFVVEADEYAGNFDPYRPAVGVLVSADWDHPDVFADEAAVVATLAAWIRRFDDRAGVPTLVANVGDAGVRHVLEALRGWSGRRLLVELVDDPALDLEARRRGLVEEHGGGVGGSDALVARLLDVGADGEAAEAVGPGLGGAERGGDVALVRLATHLLGRHMLVDGLLALAGALACGASPDAVVGAFGTFPGVGRRLELKGDVAGVVVLDDYGHHPTAMTATFAAVRQRWPGRRLWAVYEPLTFHRTAAMLEAFADVLATAERAAVVDIFAVRDPDTTIVSAKDLADAISLRSAVPARATGSAEATAAILADVVEPGDVVLVMGGGRSYLTAEQLVSRLRAKAAG